MTTAFHEFGLAVAQAEVIEAGRRLADAKDQRLAEIDAARQAGMSWEQIAERLDLPVGRVYGIVIEAGGRR